MNWSIEASEQCQRDLEQCAKKFPVIYMAVMENLEKYFASIGAAKHPKLIHFGFLHDEPMGIRAIDQSGGTLANGKKRGKLEQTRLYIYADSESQVLHLLCLGSKNSQKKDIAFSKRAVIAIRPNAPG